MHEYIDSKSLRILPLLSAFGIGCLAILFQIVLFREWMVLLEGNEFVLSFMLSAWLVGIACGALLPRLGKHETWFNQGYYLSFLSLPLVFTFSVTLVRLFPWVLSLSAEERFPPHLILLITVVPVFPLALLVGMLFPIVSWIVRSHDPCASIAQPVARVFMAESLGSVLAGILVILRVVPRYSPYDIAFFAMILIGCLLVLQARKRKQRLWIGICLLAVFLAIFFHLPPYLDRETTQIRWKSLHPGFHQIRFMETPYQRLELGERDEQYTLFGNGSPLFSWPDPYTQTQYAFMSLSQFPLPQSIALVGKGGDELADALQWHHPAHFTVYEVDAMIAKIMEEPNSEKWPHTGSLGQSFSTDFRRTLTLRKHYQTRNESKQTGWDMMILNQPDPVNGMLNRYYTRDFFQLVSEYLNQDGVLVFTITGTPNYEYGDAGFSVATLYWTLHDVFPNVIAVPGTEWWFFASPNRTLLSQPEQVIQQFKKLRSPDDSFTPDLFYLYYDQRRIEQAMQSFQQYRNVPRNTDTRPLCYLYNLILWSKQFGYLKWLPLQSLALTGWTLFGYSFIGLLLLVVIFYSMVRIMIPRQEHRIRIPLLAFFMTGAASMAAEVSILLYYQCKVGYLYQHVGIFFGVFMLGLAAGSAIGRRCGISSLQQAVKWLIHLDGWIAVGLLITPPVLWIIPHIQLSFFHHLEIALTESIPLQITQMECYFLFWLFLLTTCMGIALPVVTRVLEGEKDRSSLVSIAGWVDAGDCLGGAMGALITGGFLVPLLGLFNVFYLFAGLKCLSFITLVIGKKRGLFLP